MTTRIPSISDHLLEAQSCIFEVLDGGDNVMPREKLEQINLRIEKALNTIELVRAEVQSGLDKF